ncbi:hypothetical protein ACLB2K_077422 [Fragaria x ananassa]
MVLDIVEKLDEWIERLETYFTLYGYSSKEKIILLFMAIRLETYFTLYDYSSRDLFYSLRQRFNQSEQEYSTEFQNQAMVLDIVLEDYSVYMKYVSGLNEYIRKELRLFPVESIAEASVKAIAIESKHRKGTLEFPNLQF